MDPDRRVTPTVTPRDSDRPPAWRDLWDSFVIAMIPAGNRTRHIIKLRLRWYSLMAGVAAFMAGTEHELWTVGDLTLAACGAAAVLVAGFWNPRGAEPWWRSPRDDPNDPA
jgi:hypothetical protein